jgi:DNA-3-methyladenine glycosylase I
VELVIGDDGIPRCRWGAEPEVNRVYHDEEWGRAVTDDKRLFEKVCLEGFQAGLSWLTILRKRDRFRVVFAGFDPEEVSRFGEDEVQALLQDPGIIRHEGKIRSVVNNAARALEMKDEHGSLGAYFWRWSVPDGAHPAQLPSVTPVSTELSRDLKRRGWSFVGPTTVYAFMQAMGLVNDHHPGCHARDECSRLRSLVMGDGI